MIEQRKIRVLLVDDQKAVRYGFAMIVNKAATVAVIGACENGQEAPRYSRAVCSFRRATAGGGRHGFPENEACHFRIRLIMEQHIQRMIERFYL